MLLQIGIHHLALIDEIRIEFGPGLNVLSGETGAGKSIVVDAVNLVVGERADREMIANGSDKAIIEAVFDISENLVVQEMIRNMGIESDENMLLVSREILTSGRNLCRVNGTIVPLQMLRQISAQLVDIHGQHEHQLLLQPQNHIVYLDEYASDEVSDTRENVRKTYADWHDLALRARKLRTGIAEREQRMDMLRFQQEELRNAQLAEGEEEELERKRTLYRNAEKISSSLEETYNLLSGEGDGGSPATALMRNAARSLSGISNIDEEYDQLSTRLQGLCYEVEDVASEVERLLDSLDFDEKDAERVEDRLDLLKRLSRKYGPGTKEMIAFLLKVSRELEELEGSDENADVLEKETKRALAKLEKASGKLSEIRKKAAERFQREVEMQLHELGMKNAVFSVSFAEAGPVNAPEKRYSPDGMDQVEFMFCANLGQPLRPLTKVASGGELSRIMLALKSLSAQKPGIPRSMVFDEIDTGISGRMAQVVAEKMTAIGDHHQVICVTHLPQIAAMADHQYLVSKSEKNGKTYTEVVAMNSDARIPEIARMVGGADSGNGSSMKHAKEMLKDAEKRKQELRKRLNSNQ